MTAAQEHQVRVLSHLGACWAAVPHLTLADLIERSVEDVGGNLRELTLLSDQDLVDGAVGVAVDAFQRRKVQS